MCSSKPKFFLVWWMESKEKEVLPSRRIPPKYQKKNAILTLFRDDPRDIRRWGLIPDPNRQKEPVKVLAFGSIKWMLENLIEVDSEGNIVAEGMHISFTETISQITDDDITEYDPAVLHEMATYHKLDDGDLSNSEMMIYANESDMNASHASISIIGHDGSATCSASSDDDDDDFPAAQDETEVSGILNESTLSADVFYNSEDTMDDSNDFSTRISPQLTIADEEFQQQLLEKIAKIHERQQQLHS